ncbi:hypothetical protein Mapa_001445 [Marchantia paleacea]|nr:hypothetical protein Mapa_001445 [Marchantia paleacea]
MIRSIDFSYPIFNCAFQKVTNVAVSSLSGLGSLAHLLAHLLFLFLDLRRFVESSSEVPADGINSEPRCDAQSPHIRAPETVRFGRLLQSTKLVSLPRA